MIFALCLQTVSDVRQAFVVEGAALIALGELMQSCALPSHLTTLPFHPTYDRVLSGFGRLQQLQLQHPQQQGGVPIELPHDAPPCDADRGILEEKV